MHALNEQNFYEDYHFSEFFLNVNMTCILQKCHLIIEIRNNNLSIILLIKQFELVN